MTDPTCMGVLRSFQAEAVRLEDASFTLKVDLLKNEVMETLLYGCVT